MAEKRSGSAYERTAGIYPGQTTQVFTREQIAAVFDNLTGLTANDLRTYAMAHLAYFLGLRPQEIVQIRLGDISFKTAELTLEDRKNNIPTKLPLPERVVKAIAAYIIGGRPESKSPMLFVGHFAPYGPLASNPGEHGLRYLP